MAATLAREIQLRCGPEDHQREPRVESWAEVEAALVELGRLEQAMLAIEVERATALERVAEAARPLEAKQAELEAALERFCRERWDEFARENGQGRRSRQLLFGRVGFRRTQAVVVRSEEQALEALRRWRAGRAFLRVRTELDREGLRQFLLAGQRQGRRKEAEQRLRRAGIRLEAREAWFCELDAGALERGGSS